MGLVGLLVQSVVMGVGCFAIGSVPLSMSKQRERASWMAANSSLINTFSVGLLISTALAVVIPEGVSVVLRSVQSGKEGEREGEVHEHLQDSDEDSIGSWIGLALVAGFVLMFCLHQYATGVPSSGQHSPYHHGHHHHPYVAPSPTRAKKQGSTGGDVKEGSTTAALPSASVVTPGLGSGVVLAMGSEDEEETLAGPAARQTSPLVSTSNAGGPAVPTPRASDYFSIAGVSATSLSERASGILSADPLDSASPAFSTFVGLLFHALADGISLGAASMSTQQLPGSSLGDASSSSGLSFIIFMSLLIHKAPVAFSLTTLLLSYAPSLSTTRAYHAQIRRALVVFSLATPVGAVVTWLLLKIVMLANWSNSMDEQTEEDGNIDGIVGGNMRGRLEFWTGMALLFSAGTFLFVSTHVMADVETASSASAVAPHSLPMVTPGGEDPHAAVAKQRQRRTMAAFLAGMLTPLILSTLLGHHVH